MLEVRITLRIEDLVVDAVHHAVELVRVAPQQLIKPLAVLLSLNLGCVALADGVDNVSEMNAAAEEVDHGVEAGNPDLDQTSLFEACQHQGAKAERALGREVVDGEIGSD